MWAKVQQPPKMNDNDYGWLVSDHVLVCEQDGSMRVATYERVDEDCQPTWYSADSERWTLNTVTHWMPLPEPPKD